MGEQKLYHRARRWAPGLIAAVLAAWAGAYLAGLLVPPVYFPTATVQILAASALVPPEQEVPTITAPALAPTYARLAGSRPVLAAAMARAGLAGDPERLAAQVVVAVVPETSLLDIHVYDSDAVRGARLATAIAEALIAATEVDRQAAVDRARATLRAQIAALDAAGGQAPAADQLRAASAAYEATSRLDARRPLLRLAAAATPPAEPISAGGPLTAGLIAAVALLLALATLLLLDRLDGRLHSAADLPGPLALPVLGVIPKRAPR